MMPRSGRDFSAPLVFILLLALGCASIPGLDESGDGAGGSVSSAPEGREGAAVANPEQEASGAAGGSEDVLAVPDQRTFYGHEDLAGEAPGDRVLAKVGGREIKASELIHIYLMDNPMKLRDVLENQVLYILVEKETERLGIRVEREVVDEGLERLLRDQQGMIQLRVNEQMTLEDFVQKQYGMDMAAYREVMRKTAVFHALLERCVRFTELKVRRLRLGMIVVKELDQAGTLHKKLADGANFEVLARENSIDPSKAIGGILPPLPEDLEFPIIKEALKLGVGDLSEVEEALMGKERVYRITKLMEVIEPLRGSYPVLRPMVERSLLDQPMVAPDLVRYWRDSLEDRYGIEYHLQ